MLGIVIGLLAISAIAALLALLLEIADAYIADYGEQHILVNDQKDLAVKGGRPLLFTLAEEGIFLPSACGGKGSCGYCKVKVLEGGGPLLPTETPYLGEEEREAGVRISCQIKVKETLRIEIPEELFSVREYQARVEQHRLLTPDIVGVRLAVVWPAEGIAFKAGQYVQLISPPYEKEKDSQFRAYSIASPPHEHNWIDLLIARVEGGAVSTYVHDYLRIGEEVRIRGPFGDFYLRDSDRDILLIATGSGLAPVMSILYQIEAEKIARRTTLFFGDRKPADLLHFDELKRLEKALPRFTYIPTLSRTTASDAWEGEKGRVTDLIRKHIPQDPPCDVYICGAPAMVQSCVDLLTEMGLPTDHIWYDKFE